jgi:hypothetical protein
MMVRTPLAAIAASMPAKPSPAVTGFAAAHRLVIVPRDDGYTVAFGIGLNCGALPLFAILIGPDIGARRADIRSA